MKSLTVKKSKIHNLGVFIDESVRKGGRVAYVKGRHIRKRNATDEDALDNPDWVGISKEVWIDPVPPFKYLNHSCKPSVGIRGKITIVALRNLESGDELTIDYSTIEGDPRWQMKCSCGESSCRKVIRSINYLPKSIFKQYLPCIPTYFQSIYNTN